MTHVSDEAAVKYRDIHGADNELETLISKERIYLN